jgi:Tfp pilus assembly protein FimV
MAQDQQYGSDYIIVAPGMTLTRIMREYYPQHRRYWPELMDEVIRINPHAFVNGAPASLKRGMRLTLPKEVPSTRTTQQAAGTAAPTTETSRLSTAPLVAPQAGAAPAASTASVAPSAASQRSATTAPQQAAAAPQQPATQTIQGASQITVQEPVAALPPPVQTDLSDAGDEGTVGQGQVVAQEAPQGGSKERPPWWWILSAVVMLGLVL